MVFEGKLGFRRVRHPCDRAAIAAAELKFGQPLSDDYCQFLLEWNGGIFPEGATYFVSDEDDDRASDLKLMFGLFDESDFEDIRGSRQAYGFDLAVPPGIIPIGSNNHWDLLCLSLNAADYGVIYAWIPGEAWADQSPTREYLNFVAPNFRSLWDSIVEAE